MSFVAYGFTGYVTLLDNGGNETSKTYLLQAADAAAAATAIAAIATALTAVTDATIVAYGSTERVVNDAVTYPSAGVQIENLALVDAAILDEPTKTATFTIPAPKIGIFVGSVGAPANVVDLTDTDLIAYANLFKITTGKAYISDGETLDFMKSGKRIHRKSRNG
jgi:hypothetical protein